MTLPSARRALCVAAFLAATPVACLVVDHYDEDWRQLWWIRLDGGARVLEAGAEREAALEALAGKYPQYVDARPPGAVVAVDVTEWRAWP